MTSDRSNSHTRVFSVEEVGFFEGAEKLLEMWFDLPGSQEGSSRGLRAVPKSRWVELLDVVHCQIVSTCSNDCMDAYLLSESSMLVSWNRFILKTCGTTTLLHAIKPLMSLVQEIYPGATVMDIFYSHRSFQRPHLQAHPHHSFEEEAHFLDQIFEDGAAYALGRLNGDTWYLYAMEDIRNPLEVPDQTLEILMMGLDPALMSVFSTLVYSSAEELTKAVGLRDLFPEAILDAKIFDPCGYSLNAIVKEDTYFTVHVTPQEGCSYVSFETNLEQDSYTSLINQVIAIFRPERCTVSLFANKIAKCRGSLVAFEDHQVKGYRCNDKQFCHFVMYDLIFAHYSRAQLGSPRDKTTTSTQ